MVNNRVTGRPTPIVSGATANGLFVQWLNANYTITGNNLNVASASGSGATVGLSILNMNGTHAALTALTPQSTFARFQTRYSIANGNWP